MIRNAHAAAPNLSERKCRAIQEAGTVVFLRRGYEATSMDLIASEANVSKQTIYKHFHSKEELFKAIITDMTASLFASLSISEAAKSSPERVLRSFALEFLETMLEPSSLALYRLVVAEAARFPELGAALFAAGPARLMRMLADYLEWETRRGGLAVDDAERAAEQLLGMLTGRLQLRVLFNARAAPTQAELNSRVDYALSSFLKLHAPGRSAT